MHHLTIDLDQAFFNALLNADGVKLRELLAPDFVLIEVNAGSEIPRDVFIALVQSQELVFLKIESLERSVRDLGKVALVTGCTEMHARFGDAAMSTRSRYTHVFAEREGVWQLALAQGTKMEGI